MKLYTSGYEGLSVDAFFEALLANRVKTLIDIREAPISRKPGFSKSALSAAAQEHGLVYIHIQALGAPTEMRRDYREDQDWARFVRRYKRHLATQDEAIHDLAKKVHRRSSCLLCFEADPNRCHRSLVAQRLSAIIGSSLTIIHIKAQA
jgi:uncharacterized protein (DUF488 family)